MSEREELMDAAMALMPQQDRIALESLAMIYGTRDTDALLNHIQRATVMLAAVTGVEGQNLANGLVHHWNEMAECFEQEAAHPK